MRKPSDKQVAVLEFIGNRTVKKSEVTESFGHWYFSNKAFHIGMVLSRMVRSKYLERPKRGYYKRRGKPIVENPNQLELF